MLRDTGDSADVLQGESGHILGDTEDSADVQYGESRHILGDLGGEGIC